MKVLTIFALSASVALAAPSSPASPATPSTPSSPSSIPLGHERTISNIHTTSSCTSEAITECVTSLGLDGVSCFAQVCTTMGGATAELRRRQTTNTTTTTSSDDADLDDDIEEEEDDDVEDDFRVAAHDDTPASCTEDNLLDCAVAQWRNPDICFQQLCL
ncbi:hypothetical protein E8E14_005415 [Neopestalotiopsis sp. 37M]|nr:hypothetical protein E8E14_005415 [Neopestalotiopsis sp. 37M]